MATLYIENHPFEVPPGKNLLEVCLTLGMDLPYFCWHPALGSVGACRQCAVKIYKDENDKKGKLIMACMEPVTTNQRISIADIEAREFRDHVIEWLMTNHPHDCAVCDEGGSCHLQDMTVMTGHSYRQFKFKKRTYKNQYLGPFINHEMNRCIQCYRCVRYYKDYAGGKDLDAFASRSNVYFGRHEEGVLENEFSGNLVEVCPTGVFTDKTLKEHYTRKWDLTMAPSICQHCSLGCNTIAGERYGSLRAITNRYNGHVNGYFLCDRGRFGYDFVNAQDRVRVPIVKNGVTAEVTLDKLLKSLSSLKETKIIGIGSSRASLESNFALKKLVGDANFYQGVSRKEADLNATALSILSKGSVHVSSMKDVEKADAVLVLGEDLTNTAPMLALAVRQAVRQQPMEAAAKANIPTWHDAAVRELAQEAKGPLFIITNSATKLDEVATGVHHAATANIARLGFAIANAIDSSAPPVLDLNAEDRSLVTKIADGLLKSARPVVISGTSSGSKAVMQAAASVATALQRKNPKTGIALALQECNSMGLAILGGHPLDEAFTADRETVIILESDLYRHAPAYTVNEFFSGCRNVVVIEHTPSQTTQKATALIPTGTFVEADGTVVSNEGRAQRYFQVYEPANGIRESWRWLMQIGETLGRNALTSWKNHSDAIRSLSTEVEGLRGVDTIAPSSTFRIEGQKVPREPHRYSGRTAMNADIEVSEPKPEEDPDSPLSYTMEGLRGMPPSTMIPFFWAPGWNSVQSTNKFQEEIGGSLKGGDPGVNLIKPSAQPAPYSTDIPEAFIPKAGQCQVIPLHHIFGSEQLSAVAKGVAERSPKPYIALNEQEAKKINKKEGETTTMIVDGITLQLPLTIIPSLPTGVAGTPVGLGRTDWLELPAWAVIT